MKPLLIIFFFLMGISGCETDKGKMSDLHNADKVRVVRFIEKDTIVHDIIDRKDIRIFTDIVRERKTNLPPTKKVGHIEYFSKGKNFFKVDVTGNGIEYLLNENIYRQKLSYQAGMYFYDIHSNRIIEQ